MLAAVWRAFIDLTGNAEERARTNEVNLYIHEQLGLRIGIFADDIIVGFKPEMRDQYLHWKKQFTAIIRCSSADTI